MDVRASDAVSVPRRAVGYVTASGALSAALVAPAVVFPAYGRLLATGVVCFALALTARGALAAALAFRPLPDPPPSDVDRLLANASSADRSSADRSSAEPSSTDRSSVEVPTVSVVVAAYDEAETLPATVEACRNLAYPDDRLEILLCYESASSDATPAIAERAAEDPRFRAVRRDAPPGGKAGMANFGLERADGEVVGFVDAGQRPEPKAVRRAVGWFLADDDRWCVKGRCFATNAGDSLFALHSAVERHLAERGEFFAREVLSGFTLFTGGFAFFRADAFERLGSFDETVLLEDVEFAARVHSRGRTVKVDPAIVSKETNPETFAAWWNRRKRWARGGMQVARRYVSSLPRNPNVRPTVAFDAATTFGALLVLPVVLLASPVVALSFLDGGSATYLPAEQMVGVLLLAGAVASPLSIFVRDHLDGRGHSPREYAAAFTLPAYYAVEAVVVVAAFLDEFVLRRSTVYVPSDRPGEDP